MSANNPIHVNSEIGSLKRVLLHRPGKELENLVPDYLGRLLFDDIPFLKGAQEEHDNFAKVLEENGTEVVYLERLAAEAIDESGLHDQFIDEWLKESGLQEGGQYEEVRSVLQSYDDTFEMVLKTMEGFKKKEIDTSVSTNLSDSLKTDYPFLVDPMPNLYFARDPFATMGNGISLNHMFSETRNRETLYGDYIFKHHPVYGGNKTPLYYNRNNEDRIEGGDELVLSKDTLAIGISQRTDSRAIEQLAKNIFGKSDFKEIIAFSIASNRKFMHLDTVFTMVDYDKFTIHPEIEGGLKVFSLTADGKGGLTIREKTDKLENVLADALDLDHVKLIRCGGNDIVAAAREQWNDGANTLSVRPGEVIVYERNVVTNDLLDKAGVKLLQIPASELVRGRGGPRCMSMPLVREDI